MKFVFFSFTFFIARDKLFKLLKTHIKPFNTLAVLQNYVLIIRNIYIHCVTCAIGTIQSLKSYFLLDHFKFLFETSHGPFKARRLPKDSPEITQVFPKNPRRLPGDQPETNQKPIGDLPETPEISNQPLGSLLKTFVRSLEGLLAITGDSLVCLWQLSIGPPVSLRRISGSSRCSMGSLWAVSS